MRAEDVWSATASVGSRLVPSPSKRRALLGPAVRAVVEGLEGRQLMAADPFELENAVQPLPFVQEFDGASTSGLHDKDGQHIGFTRVQVNRNGRDASYVPSKLDLTGGVLKVTTTGTATSGSNFNGDNTLTNAVETTFDATTGAFQIKATLVGPLSYINEPSEQAGISFGPGQDDYVKLVAIATPQGPHIQFVDERLNGATYVHDLDGLRDAGSFGSINSLELRIAGDPATGMVRGYFTVNGGTLQKFSQELALSGTRKTAFFSGAARAGLVATHKNNTGAITASFDRFEVKPGTPPAASTRPSIASVSPGRSVTGVSRDAFVSAQLNLTAGGIRSDTLTSSTVRLYRKNADGTRSLVPANIGTSGAGDVIILTPSTLLAKSTGYTFEVTSGLKDVAGNSFNSFSSSFTTGTTGGEVDTSFSFDQVDLPTAAGERFTTLKVGPDRRLYAGTVNGRIFRFSIRSDGTLGSPQVLDALLRANGGNKRLLTGFTFDPASTASNPILWVTHGQYRFGLNPAGTVDQDKYADDWTGKISKITNLGGSNTGTVADVVKGLPRSVRDHLTNQPSFGPDGALYIPQGSNSATGAPDVGWGNRPERLLSGAILRLDPSKVPAGTSINVKTQDGGTYNPSSTGAPLTIYAKGVRNAYDLVWTADGKLYAPTNGSAKGGNTPAGDGVRGLTNVGAQHDFLFQILKGGYYGHPNALRGDYVLNGGYTPENGVGPNEVPEYGAATPPDSQYKGYVHDFGTNVSPNGAIEYRNTSHFGGRLAGKLLVTRYSGPDDVVVLTRDSSGAIVRSQANVAGLGGLVDPLDIVEDRQTGFLYVSEYSERDATQRRITLLRPSGTSAEPAPTEPTTVSPAAQATLSTRQLVFTDIQTPSTRGSGASASQSVTIRNTGTSTMTIAAGGATISGTHASQFEADAWPSLPRSVAPGSSVTFKVRFRAASTGVKTALLRVVTSAGTQSWDLRGIGTTSDSSGEVSGSNEPSLQRILNAFQIPVNVGDANGESTYDLPTPRPSGTAHDEVTMPRLRKAGTGSVRIEALAGYGFNAKTGPVGHFGLYKPGSPDARTELFTVANAERTSTNPTWGATFDPGSAPFSLYGTFNGSLFESGGLPYGVYSEDKFNTFDSTNKRKVRFFPLKNKDGSTVTNAYVFAFEEYKAGYDSNDIIGIIRNVAPASSGPEVGTENLDRGTPYSDRLVFNRIQTQPPKKTINGVVTTLPNNGVHNKAKVRVHNSGSSSLLISSVVLSNTTDFQVNTTGLAGLSIPAGGSKDIEVQFKATTGRVKTGTLTINTNDADEKATVVQLSGYWQNKSENNEEPSLQEFMQIFGYSTKITNTGESLSVAGDEGRVRRVGDEVLSAYWRRADAGRGVEVVQLAAFHSHNDDATIRWHYKGSSTLSEVFTHEAVDGQSILPRKAGSTSLAAGPFRPVTQGTDPNPAFGFKVDGEWSDPTKNRQEKSGGGYGHHIRFWPAKDRSGRVIPDTYVMGMDYEGINYDYQDNLYLVKNIKPAG